MSLAIGMKWIMRRDDYYTFHKKAEPGSAFLIAGNEFHILIAGETEEKERRK